MVQADGERDVTSSADLEAGALRQRVPGPPAELRVSQRVVSPVRVVPVTVNGRLLQLPENVLNAGASLLQLTTEGSIPLEDYAESVGRVREGLERLRVASFRS